MEMMLDKKQIWAIFLFEFKMGGKTLKTTCSINNAFGPETANKRMVQWWLRSFVYVPQLSYPFVCWRTSRLLPCPGYNKQCCNEHWGTRVLHTDFSRGRLGGLVCPQFIVIHTVKGFDIVTKAEIDVFLELSWFFDDPADVGHLISGSSAFSKTRTSGSSQFTYSWSLAWRILSITLLACEMSAIVQ